MNNDTPRTEKAAAGRGERYLGGTVDVNFARELERDNNRLRAFAESVKDIALRPIEASDAMDEIDTLVVDYFALPNTKTREPTNE